VNRFRIEGQTAIPVLRINEELERQQIERLREIKGRRDEQSARDALDRVEQTARSGENLMPHIITAVESYATLGEISDRLRRVFGEYTDGQ
jgi:methylmalonyl-CoA mutase N-terminal domain/subunit